MVIKIEIYELLKAFSMQKKCFKPIYEKYYDEQAPTKSHLQNLYQEQQSRVFKCIG